MTATKIIPIARKKYPLIFLKRKIHLMFIYSAGIGLLAQINVKVKTPFCAIK